MRRHHLLLALAASLLVGVLAGWFQSPPSNASGANNGDAPWALPDATTLERSSATLDAGARSLRWVGGNQGGDTQGGQASEWTLLGILPRENAVLVRAGTGDAISRVEVGATLPDGTRLTSVARDSAMIERDGCPVGRSLYPRPTGDTAPSACNDAAPPKEVPPP